VIDLIGLRVTFAEIINTARSWPLIAIGTLAMGAYGHRALQ
jgi:hypothetical protein